MGVFPTKNDHDLGCEMGENPPFKETPENRKGNDDSIPTIHFFWCDLFGLKRTVILVGVGVLVSGAGNPSFDVKRVKTFDRSTASLTQLL